MHKQHLPDLDERARQAMLDNGFEPDFTPEVAQQIDEIEADGPAGLSPGVRDLRNVLWSSIDNRSSKDLDQVEFAEELENGDIRLLVGIADVDSLVGKGSAIDKHAAENTVTVYTESEIFPVLPEQLSTDLTSLREGEDREAIVVELIIKANGDVPGNN
ncbi:MAG TPA: RNB domain-containing ribonuclease, partial [Pyrinomonadaceae bacterium]|nr:RNB domain-containing ribonuclease [Pyrinomonadaceae bacterium]